MSAVAALASGTSISVQAASAEPEPVYVVATEKETSHWVSASGTLQSTEEIYTPQESDLRAESRVTPHVLYKVLGSKDSPVTLTGVDTSLSLTINANAADPRLKAFTGSVLDVGSNASVEFSGSSTNINLNLDGVSSVKEMTAFAVGTGLSYLELHENEKVQDGEQGSIAFDGTPQIIFSADNTSITAKAQSSEVTGSRITLVGVGTEDGTIKFVGKNVNITVESDNARGYERENEESEFSLAGIAAYGEDARIYTSLGTNLEVNVTGTGESVTNDSGPADAIALATGGVIKLYGNTTVNVNTVEGEAEGIELELGSDAAKDSLSEVNGSLTIKTNSTKGTSFGIALDVDEKGTSETATFRSTGKLDITAKSAESGAESYGILISSQNEEEHKGDIGNAIVELKGISSISAKHVFYTDIDDNKKADKNRDQLIVVSNDATFTGNVNEFYGKYKQTAGTVKLNGNTGFFGGSFELLGGTFEVASLDRSEKTSDQTIHIGGAGNQARLYVTGKVHIDAEDEGFVIKNNGILETNYSDDSEKFSISKIKVEEGGTLRLNYAEKTTYKVVEINKLKEDLLIDDRGLLDLINVEIEDIDASGGAVTATAISNLGNITNNALKAATVTGVDANGISGAFKAVELAENTESLSLSGKTLALVGSADGGALATAKDSTAAVSVNLSGGNLTLGTADAANKGTIGTVTLGNGTLNVVGSEGASFDVATIEEADTGSVNVSGATANIASDVKVKTVTVESDGHLSLAGKTLAVSGTGENASSVAGKVSAAELTGEGDMNIGVSSTAGEVSVATLSSTGTIFLDPVWMGEEQWGDGSYLVADEVKDGKLTATLAVGMNSSVVLGGTKEEAVEYAAGTNLSYGRTGIGSVIYVGKALDVSGGALVANPLYASMSDISRDSNIVPVEPGTIALYANSLLMVNGAEATADKAVLTTTGTMTMQDGAKLAVVNTQNTNEAKSLISFGELKGLTADKVDLSITNENLSSFVVGSNALQQITFTLSEDKKSILYTAEQKKAGENAFAGTEIASLLNAWGASGLGVDEGDKGARFLSRVANYTNYGFTSEADAVKASNQAAALAAEAGVYNAALDASDLMNRSVDHRMTMAGTFDRSHGVTLWADVLATTNEAKKLYGSAGYDMDLYGAVLGADTEVVPGAIVGAAVTVGTGDGGSKGAAIDVDNDVDFAGISIYGSHRIGDFNGKADIGWMHTKSDVKAHAFGMSIGDEISADAFTIGFGGEYLVKLGSFNVIPHAGIRWTRLDVDGYSGALATDDDTMNIFTLPVGVAFSGNFNAGSWKIAPAIDLAVVPSFGDDEATSKVRWGSASDTIKTQVVDDAPFQASLGLSAQNGKWTVGASYDLGVGGDDRLNNAFTLRAAYAF